MSTTGDAPVVRWRAKPHRRPRRGIDTRIFARYPGLLERSTRSLLALPPGSRRRRWMFERAFRSGFDANARGRTEETLPFFDPGVQLFITSENATVPPGTRRHYIGYEDFVAFFEVWSEVWKEWRLELHELFDLGDRLVITGTTVGLGQMSGIELRQQQAGIWTFAGGRCVQVNLFWNHVEALEAAGLDAIAEEYRSRADAVG